MKWLQSIPRGLVVFIGVLIVVALAALGYRFLFGGAPAPEGTAEQQDVFSSLFPFGRSTESRETPAQTPTPLLTLETGEVPLLRHVAMEPASGVWFAAGESTTSAPRIRFMERATGHLYETRADSLTTTRISNTTVPGIEELFAATDLTLIARSLDDIGEIENFYGIVNATSSQRSLTLTRLRPFTRVAIAHGRGGMLTVTETTDGSRVEFSKPDGSGSQTLLTSAIASWVPLLGGARTFLETAPTAVAEGYLYELAGGALKKISGGLPGFTALISPSGRYVAQSGNTADGFSFSVIDTQNNTVYESPARATALKCAWVPNKEPLLFCAIPKNPPAVAYPDDWFLGNVFLADEAWIISPTINRAYFIGTLTDERGIPLDAVRVAVDASGSYALFMNKRDLSVWSLNIMDAVKRTAVP